jgi:hypothetical protein
MLGEMDVYGAIGWGVSEGRARFCLGTTASRQVNQR